MAMTISGSNSLLMKTSAAGAGQNHASVVGCRNPRALAASSMSRDHRASSRVEEIIRTTGCGVELCVIRHGETEDNKTRTIAGHNAGKLSALGITQVVLAADMEIEREEEDEQEQ